MNNLQRIYQLHRILASHRLPVSHKRLEKQLECSRATVTRTITALRLYFNAPLEYDRERNGYYYDARESGVFELPGVWFDAHELYALLAVQQLLEHIQPGLLGAQLKAVKERLESVPHTRGDEPLGTHSKNLFLECLSTPMKLFIQLSNV